MALRWPLDALASVGVCRSLLRVKTLVSWGLFAVCFCGARWHLARV
jgi:hypothetical protein